MLRHVDEILVPKAACTDRGYGIALRQGSQLLPRGHVKDLDSFVRVNDKNSRAIPCRGQILDATGQFPSMLQIAIRLPQQDTPVEASRKEKLTTGQPRNCRDRVGMSREHLRFVSAWKSPETNSTVAGGGEKSASIRRPGQGCTRRAVADEDFSHRERRAVSAFPDDDTLILGRRSQISAVACDDCKPHLVPVVVEPSHTDCW
mmetsp:Transcript_6924/g.16041  ORF Transcript_6924/g.16041 Transcript_6924/m.16041 type:complete len:203 (+) Transcript_6924:634-1242(+)